MRQTENFIAPPAARLISIAPSDLEARVIQALDIAAGVLLALFFLPLLLLIALAIKLTSPGPIFFAQNRVGRNGHSFKCYKFRSMVIDSQARLEELLRNDPAARLQWLQDHKLRNDPRVTLIGAFLRKSSFDELPQFLNLINGTMSLVGPRPIVTAEIERYGRRFHHYCSVKPGITGLWQVSGRSNTTYRRRVAMDVTYAKRQSIGLNAMIIFQTIPAVLAARGSY